MTLYTFPRLTKMEVLLSKEDGQLVHLRNKYREFVDGEEITLRAHMELPMWHGQVQTISRAYLTHIRTHIHEALSPCRWVLLYRAYIFFNLLCFTSFNGVQVSYLRFFFLQIFQSLNNFLINLNDSSIIWKCLKMTLSHFVSQHRLLNFVNLRKN